MAYQVGVEACVLGLAEIGQNGPKSQKCANFAIWGVPKMVLPVPETKIRDHFYRPNTPPKPRKKHLGIAFLSLESVFLAILFILHILSRF